MATIQPPLNHFITDLYSPDQTRAEVLQGNITSLERKSTIYSALEKICYVALVAIIATAVALSYNVLAVAGTYSILFTAMFLITPVFIIAPSKFAQLSNQYAHLAETESRVALKLREIEDWSSEQVTEFIRGAGLQIGQIDQEALRRVSPQEPLKALTPLIARYIAMKDEVEKIQREYRDSALSLEAEFARQEALRAERNEGPIETSIKQKIRYENQCEHWAKMELRAFRTAIDAATILETMRHPTQEDLDIIPFSLTVPGLGQCEPKNYAERMFAKTNVPPDVVLPNGERVPNTEVRDTYFVFHPNLRRAPLTHQQIADTNLAPHLLRPMLYP